MHSSSVFFLMLVQVASNIAQFSFSHVTNCVRVNCRYDRCGGWSMGLFVTQNGQNLQHFINNWYTVFPRSEPAGYINFSFSKKQVEGEFY